MSRYNYRGALTDRLGIVNRLLSRPSTHSETVDGKYVANIGFIGWTYNGLQARSFSVYEVCTTGGGIRVLYTAGSKKELLSWVDGYLDGIRQVKQDVA